MATTDTRSGFRLPWSSDRSQEDTLVQDAQSGAEDPVAAPDRPAMAWPERDVAPQVTVDPARQPLADATEAAEEAPSMTVSQPAPTKRPTKLMADLAAAIRATTEAARDQQLGQLDAEAAGIVEMIRAQSDEGAVALRRQSDEDVAAIREWSKAEIARIKEETEARITDRKHLLDQEVADHAAAIEDRVAQVHRAITGYREAMDAYFERLLAEEDPARLATMAEAMPEPPSLGSLTDLDDASTDDAERQDAAAEVDAAPVAVAVTPAATDADEESDGSAPAGDDEFTVSDDRIASVLGGYGDDAPVGAAEVETAASDDTSRWAAGEAPEGFPESSEVGDPVDRGAIMAALEAAAEAVVAAESAAESAVTAEAAADVAETAAELVAGRTGSRDEADAEADAEAEAALAARIDAGGFETESYQDRLASLHPGRSESSAEGEPQTTQVVVTGLVSVASIASFKRHLGRLAGVTGVAVASGPEGEFIFNTTHRADVSFRDAIPTLPGFAARVIATGDGVVNVTAHDPEAEG